MTSQEQYQTLVESAGQIDLSDRTRIEVTGDDRASFLHNMCTNDVKKLSPGQGCEAFFTNVQGKILGHGYIQCRESTHVIDTVAGQAEPLLAQLDRYIIREDVQLTDRTDAWQELLVAGPRSAEILAELFGELPSQRLALCQATVLPNVSVVVSRVDWVPGDAFTLQFAQDAGEAVSQALAKAGIAPCDRGWFDVRRIEKGTPLYGRDISAENLPQELNRDAQAISFTKGCYLGQETVARIDALGHVNRLLVGLQVAGNPPDAGTELTLDGKPVGKITSAAFSPGRSATIGLGFVRRGHQSPGQTLDSSAGPVEVVELPG